MARPRGTGSITRQTHKDGRVTWTVRYYDTGGVQRKRSGFTDKKDAERFLKHTLADVSRGDYLDPALGKRPFHVFAKAWLALKGSQVKPRTAADYRSHLRLYVLPAFGNRPVASIAPVDVERFVAGLRARGVSPATVRNVVIKVLKPILSRAVRDGAIKVSPAADLRLPKPRGRAPMHFLTAEQVAALAETIDPPYGVLVYFLAYTGLRWGEASGLRRRRVDLLHGRVEVAEVLSEFKGAVTFGPPKTEASERTVTLPRFLVRMMDEYLAQRPGGPDDLVFTAPRGGALNNRNFRQRIYQPAVRRELPPELHRLRIHDYAEVRVMPTRPRNRWSAGVAGPRRSA